MSGVRRAARRCVLAHATTARTYRAHGTSRRARVRPLPYCDESRSDRRARASLQVSNRRTAYLLNSSDRGLTTSSCVCAPAGGRWDHSIWPSRAATGVNRIGSTGVRHFANVLKVIRADRTRPADFTRTLPTRESDIRCPDDRQRRCARTASNFATATGGWRASSIRRSPGE